MTKWETFLISIKTFWMDVKFLKVKNYYDLQFDVLLYNSFKNDLANRRDSDGEDIKINIHLTKQKKVSNSRTLPLCHSRNLLAGIQSD